MPHDVPTQACTACGNLVDIAAVEPLATIACPKCGAKLRAERAFDHFLLVETLGVGGMGSVFKARDTRLDRFVALKLLHKELSADPAEAARLEQEARLTAAVNHPHVVQVYSAGHAHDQIYLVMELVAHGSLDDLLAQHPHVPEAQVLRAGLQVAKGLQAAHEKGLIHRDVKPANILFANAETAKIGDFGLAVTAGQQAEAAREIWGTPYYVAPERLNNEPEDFRSDIYSLGATLFHALAGQPPIEGETTSASELRKLKSHPPDLRAIVPEVSRETARVIAQMLAPDPAARFASYTDLIDALDRAATGGDTAPSSREKSRALLGTAAGFLALATLIAGVVYFRQQKQTLPPVDSSTPIASAPAKEAPAVPPRDGAAELQREQEQQAAEKAATEEKAREAERLRAAESPAWEKALADAHAKVVVYDFAGAFTAINAARVTEPSLVAAQETERKKVAWLTDWKKKLITDLNAQRFIAEVQIGNANYTGAAKADDSGVTFILPPYGTAAVDWPKIPAKTLLAISLSVFKPESLDAADRNWLAAIFALETGQPEAARRLAEVAAKAKPEYRDQLDISKVEQP